MTAQAQTFEFKSEARQLLDLMIHSLYSNKEVFLRELISNSSDAIDRLRFDALTRPELRPEGHEFEIRISGDGEARTLTVEDTGIGMSREEVVTNLGTIARSGTREFMKQLAEAEGQAQREALIGQFGVGFYASFMVADEVTVLTRRAGEEGATLWRSSGDGTFTVEDASRDDIGTTITLHLKPADPENNLPDFTEDWALRRVIKKYSDFVQHPIKLREERQEAPEGEDEEDSAEEREGATVVEWNTVNSRKAIWTRSANEVKDEEYNEFYRHVSNDWTDPLDRITFKGEGTFEYTALLYIPARAPFDLFYRNTTFGLQLYVNRVLVMEEARDLIPDYLRFLKGVVDSPDLSLNVSREILQKDRRVNAIRSRITKKVIEALAWMQGEEQEKYLKFWEAFGRVIKEGVTQDFEHRSKLAELLWFESTATDADAKDGARWTSLKRYVEAMKEGQEDIYYIVGDSRAAASKSPHLEAFRKRGFEVLFFLDPIDEIMVSHLGEFEGKKLKPANSGDVNLSTDEEREQREEKEKTHKSLLEHLQGQLHDHVKEVRLSARLTDSPVCLVGEEGEMSPQLRKLMEEAGQVVPPSRRVLELNPDHPILARLQTVYDASQDDPKLADYAHLLHGQALLAEGSALPDPVDFSRRLAELMVRDAQ